MFGRHKKGVIDSVVVPKSAKVNGVVKEPSWS